MISKKNNKVRITGNGTMAFAGFFLLVLTAVIIYLCLTLPFSSDTGIPEFVVLFVSIAVLLCSAVFSLISGCRAVTLDEGGIRLRGLFAKKDIIWSDINDYGISYLNSPKGQGRIFYLYFSTTELETGDYDRKRMKRGIIKIIVKKKDGDKIFNTVLPYCAERLDAEPFISQAMRRSV